LKVLLADLETRSRVDLRAAGHRRYSKDPSTSITTAAWKWKGLSNSLTGAVFIPGLQHPGAASPWALLTALAEADRVVFHNASFDANVIRETLGFEIPLHKLSCTMARAQRMSLPGGLDKLCETLGVPGKSTGGNLLVMKTCKPQRDGTFCEDPDVFRDLFAYNLQDVRALESVDERLPELPPSERMIWERTWRKNEKGLPIDLALAEAVAARREEIELEVANQLRALTGGAVTAVTQRARIQTWLSTVGVPVQNMRKETIEELLEAVRDGSTEIPADAYDVLEIVYESGGMAPTKARSLLDRQCGGVFHDHTRYFGARSGRGTSEGVNTFNLARPSGKHDIEAVIGCLLRGERAGGIIIPKEGENPFGVKGLRFPGPVGNVALTDVLRGLVAAPEGYAVLDVDEANIELRIALWLAGDQTRLDVLAQKGGDIYMHNAIEWFGLPPDATKKTHPKERQDSKPLTLGGNYGLGDNRFYVMNRRAIPGLTPEKAKAWIQRYRSSNPKLAAKDGLWRQLDNAAREAFWRPDLAFGAANGKAVFCYSAENPWPMSPEDRLRIGGERVLWLRLPSGRPLPHYSPRIDRDTGEMTFLRSKFGRMLPQRAYGGAWTEILCQSSGRDILTGVEAAVERELPDVDIRMDVYDSIVALCPAHVAEQRERQIEAIMRRPVPWAPGLPLDADGYFAQRMKK
jgi:DNA polymerase bacteriophage-type